jgi:serine/threonine-protein kinase RsbW
MVSGRPEAAGRRSRLDGGYQLTLRSVTEINPVLDTVTATMAAEGYPAGDLLAVRLVLTEALANAIRHGNRNDPAKRVRVCYHVGAEWVLAEVEDEGPGFDPEQVRDPPAPEDRGNASGRGLLLMRFYTTWLRFNDRGNSVAFGRLRSAP